MNIPAMRELIRVLKAVPPEHFDMSSVAYCQVALKEVTVADLHTCGSAACAIGYAAVDAWFQAHGLCLDLSHGLSYTSGRIDADVAAGILGLSEIEFDLIHVARHPLLDYLPFSSVTPANVVAAVEAMIAEYEAAMKTATMKTTAIQVIPVIEGLGEVELQFEGPTADTTGWGVYLRKEDGTVEWFADVGNEPDAAYIGVYLASCFGVELEHQPWSSGSSANTLTFRATVEIELTATSLKAANSVLVYRLSGCMVGDDGIDDYRIDMVRLA